MGREGLPYLLTDHTKEEEERGRRREGEGLLYPQKWRGQARGSETGGIRGVT